MPCYFRPKQMKDIFERAGVVITKENRKDVDRVIHSIVGIEYSSCHDTWRAVKAMLADDEDAFIRELRVRASETLRV